MEIIGTETQEIQTLIQRDCISIHEDCILLQILLGKNNNLKTLENVLKSQAHMEIHQLAGQKEAFQGYSETYVELAKRLITYNRNRDGKI